VSMFPLPTAQPCENSWSPPWASLVVCAQFRMRGPFLTAGEYLFAIAMTVVIVWLVAEVSGQGSSCNRPLPKASSIQKVSPERGEIALLTSRNRRNGEHDSDVRNQRGTHGDWRVSRCHCSSRFDFVGRVRAVNARGIVPGSRCAAGSHFAARNI